jgi:peptidoglycan/LPS O-acetylase OafA/YrhL
MLIGCYLLIEIFGRHLRRWVGRFIHVLILINIAAFIPAFIIMAEYPTTVPPVPAMAFLVSTVLMMFPSIIILGMLIPNVTVIATDHVLERLSKSKTKKH